MADEEEWRRFRPSEGTTKYFIMKVKTEEQLLSHMDSNTYQPSYPFVRGKLMKSLNESDQVVIIIIGSDCFQAYATISKDQSVGDQEPLKTSSWSRRIVKLGFHETEHILNMMFNQNPVNRSKDGQPVDAKAALWVISLIDDKIEALLPSTPAPASSGNSTRGDSRDKNTIVERDTVDTVVDHPSSNGVDGPNGNLDVKVGNKRTFDSKGDGDRDIPPTKLDKFGGSGLIPFDVTNINDYEDYLKKHHQFMVEKYHDFMKRVPDYFVDQQRW